MVSASLIFTYVNSYVITIQPEAQNILVPEESLHVLLPKEWSGSQRMTPDWLSWAGQEESVSVIAKPYRLQR